METIKTWKFIRGYEFLYKINQLGDVKRVDGDVDKVIKPVMNNGYKRIALSKNGKYKLFYIHRLIAENFIPNPGNLPIINHRDGDKLNNSVDNIEWCTYLHNNTHAVSSGLRGVKVCRICAKTGITERFNSYTEAVKNTDGASFSGISNVISGRAKTHAGFFWHK